MNNNRAGPYVPRPGQPFRVARVTVQLADGRQVAATTFPGWKESGMRRGRQLVADVSGSRPDRAAKAASVAEPGAAQ
jgi:hypothetical protein